MNNTNNQIKTEEQTAYERKLAALGFGKDSAPKAAKSLSETIPNKLVQGFGGVVGEYADYINSISPALNPHTAFLGSLSFCSFCASRHYRTESNLTPELYIVALCPSGGGKDLPRKTNQELAFQIGAVDNVVMDIASGEGGEDAIMDHAKILAQIDEFDTLLRAIAEDRGGTKESLVRFLLQAYSSAGGMLKRRQKARGKDSQNSRSFCHRPGLIIFGTGIKSMFFAALNERAMMNGMFARMLVCPCAGREEVRDVKWTEIPQRIVSRFASIAGSAKFITESKVETWRIPDKPNEKPNPMVVPMDDSARMELERITIDADQWYHSFPDTEDGEPGRAIANRRRENAIRLALLRAVSRENVSPIITAEDLKWGESFAKWSQGAMLKAAAEYCFTNPFDEQLMRVKRMLKGGKVVTKRDICRSLHIKVEDVDAVIDALIMDGSMERTSDNFNAFRAVKAG